MLSICSTVALIRVSRGSLFPKSADCLAKGNAAKTSLFLAAQARYFKAPGAKAEVDFTTLSNYNQEMKCKAIMDYTETFLGLRDKLAANIRGPLYDF